jgi:hypothetical protein
MTPATESALVLRCAALSTIAGGGAAASARCLVQHLIAPFSNADATNENAVTWRVDGANWNNTEK